MFNDNGDWEDPPETVYIRIALIDGVEVEYDMLTDDYNRTGIPVNQYDFLGEGTMVSVNGVPSTDNNIYRFYKTKGE